MKRAKKMLAFVLAGVMLMSNVAYAAPTTDADGTDAEVAVDTLSLDPKEETGGETPSDDASDTNTAAETTEQAPVESTPADTETQPSDSALTDGTEPAPAGGTEVTMPSEDGQETLPDENNATEDEVTGAADSAQAYDITFESKEQHGQVLTMDDQEVREGEILKTDENGMAQFKVKANDGYEVEKVVNKADNIPLTLIENSYYEIQVDGSTVIEIHYKKIPANEDADEADDNGDDAKTEEGSVTDSAVGSVPRMSIAKMVEEYANEVIQVAISGVDGQSTVDLPVGTIADNAPEYENYTYEYATIGANGAEVVAIGVYEIGDTRYEYYSTDGESAQLIGDNQVVLHYSKNALNISYSVTPEAEAGTIIGPSSAQAGTNVSFIVEPALGYKTADVKVNGNSVYVAGQEVYTFAMPNSATTVEATFAVADSYTVTLNPLGNSADYDQHDYLGADCQTPSEVIVRNGDTLTTYIYTDATADGRPLQYIVVNGQRIEVNNNDDTSATVDGMNISITKMWHRHTGLSWQYFEVTIQNVQQDISIDYFIKDERGTDERTIQVDELGEGLELYVKEENSDRLRQVSQDDVYTLGAVGSQIYFYAKADPGYQVASIEGEGVSTFSNILTVLDYPGATEALAYGCQWELHFTRYIGDEANRTLSFQAIPIEYTVSYDANGGTPTPTDNNKYSIAEESNVITLAAAPEKEGEVFIGWRLDDQIYDAGESIIIDDDFLDKADSNNNFKFVAQWAKETEVADYTVEYYKETVIGTYPSEPTLIKLFRNATVGDTAVANAIPSELDIKGYVLDTNHEEFQVTGVVTDNNSLVLKVFYALDTNNNGTPDNDELVTLTFISEKGFVMGDSPYLKEKQVPGLAFQAPTPVDTDTDNVVFVGWDNGLAKNGAGTVPAEDTTYTAQYKEDLNNDGTPDDEQYVDVTFTIAEEDAAKGTLEGETSYTDLVPGLELTVPEVADTEGDDWAFDGWTPALTEGEDGNVLVPSETTNYVATWKEDKNHDNIPDEDQSYNLTITYTYASGEEGSTSALPSAYTQEGLAVGQGYSVPSPAVSGYVARPSVVSGTIYDSDVNVTVIYYRDSNGNGEPDRDESYSLTIYYAFAAGEAGNASLPGTYTASGLTVGYNYSVTSPWVSGYVARPAVVSGTIYDSNVTATVYYYIDSNGNGVPDSEEPVAPDPGTPGNNRPAETGAGDTAEAAAETAETDEYDLTEIDRDDDRERTTIDEDDTPLGNKDLNEADAESESEMCILHWLILLAALIIALFFILDGSRRQKRIDDLKDQLKKGRR